MPMAERSEMHTLLRTYTAAVQVEWDRSDDGDTSDAARGAITQMYRVHFGRQLGVTPAPFEHAVQALDGVDGGT